MSKILPLVVVCCAILLPIHDSYAVERIPRPDPVKHDFYFDDKVSPFYKSPAESSHHENTNPAVSDSAEAIREPEKSKTHENVTQEFLHSNSDPENIANWNLKRLLQHFIVLLNSMKDNNSRYKEYNRVRNEGMPSSRRTTGPKLKANSPQNANGKHKVGDRNEFVPKPETSTGRYETSKGFNNGDKNSNLKVIEDRKTNVSIKPELQNQETISKPEGKIKNGYAVMNSNTLEPKNTGINNSSMKADPAPGEFIDDYINFSPTKVSGAKNETSSTKTSYPDETKHEMNKKLNDPLTFKNLSRLQLNNGPVSASETTDRNNKSHLTKIPQHQRIHHHIIPEGIISSQPKQANLTEESKIPSNSKNNRNKEAMHNQPTYPFNTNPQSIQSHAEKKKLLQFKNNSYMKQSRDVPETMKMADKLEKKQEIEQPNFESFPKRYFDDQARQTKNFDIDGSNKTRFRRYKPKSSEYISELGNTEKRKKSFIIPSYQNKKFVKNPNNQKTFYNNANSPQEMKLTQSKEILNQNDPRNLLDRSQNSSVLHDPPKNPSMNKTEQLTPETNILPEDKSSKIDEQILPYSTTFRNTENITNLERNSNPETETALNDPNPFTDVKLNQANDRPNQTGHENVLDRSPENSTIFDNSSKKPSKNENKQLRPEIGLLPKEESSKIDEQIPQYTSKNPDNITNLDRNNNPIEETAQNNPYPPMTSKMTQVKDMPNQNVSRNILDRNSENSPVLDDSPKYPSMKENKQLKPEIDLIPQEETSEIDEQIPQYAFNNPEDITNIERNNNSKEETVQNNPSPPVETKLTQVKDMSNQNVPRNVLDRNPENSSVLEDSPKYPSTNENKQLGSEAGDLPHEKSSKIYEQVPKYTFNNPKDITNSELYKPEENTTKNDLTESEISPTESPNSVTATVVSYTAPSEREMSTTPSESESENIESDTGTGYNENSDSDEEDNHKNKVQEISNLQDSGEKVKNEYPMNPQLDEEDNVDKDKVQEISNFQDFGEVENESSKMSQTLSEPYANNSMKMELPKNFTEENRDNVLPTQETDSGGNVQSETSQMSELSSEPNIKNSTETKTPVTLEKDTVTNDTLPTEVKYNTILEYLYQHSNNPAITNMKALKKMACN